jgi:hypothetical protein
MVLDIKVDRNLIAGAAVFYNGKYSDFSIKKKFDEVLKNVISRPQVDEKHQPTELPQEAPKPQNVDFFSLGRH